MALPQPGPAGLAYLLGAILLLAGCSRSNQKEVYPVRGEVFVASQPAAGALVILHPVESTSADDWPSGYPRGTVQQDGTFEVTTYESPAGAPSGRYVALVEWKATPSEGADPESARGDRLAGRYMDPKKSKLHVEVVDQPVQLPRFNLE